MIFLCFIKISTKVWDLTPLLVEYFVIRLNVRATKRPGIHPDQWRVQVPVINRLARASCIFPEFYLY